ncbi:MAG: PKD repeat protein, partial [Candidatus Azotimanducaceae bacterium]
MKKIIYSSLILVLLSLCAIPSFFNETKIDEKEAFSALLKAHPFNQREVMTTSEWKCIPKKDRPDLANEHDFLITMDPKLGRPTPEVLIPTIKYVNKRRQMLRNKTLPGGAGEAWVERGPNNVGGRTRAIMFDPNDQQNLKVWAGGVGGGLWYTNDITNDATGWQNVDDFWANIAITAMAYDPTNTQIFYVGTGEGWYNSDAQRGGGLWKTTDGGSTWAVLNSTTGSDFVYIQDVLVHPVTGDVYVATRAGTFRSTNNGTSFSQVIGGASADLEIGADNTIYLGKGVNNSGFIYKSTTGNSGDWTLINGNGFPTSGIERIEIGVSPANANVVYAMTQGTDNDVEGIYKSSNKGASWTSITLPVWRNGDNFARGQAWYDLIMGVDPTNENVLYIGGVDLFKSTNGGATWVQLTDWWRDPSDAIYAHADQHAIQFRPGNPSFVVFGNDGGISVTSNAGTSFSTRVNGYNVTQFYSAAMHPSAGNNIILGGAQDNGSHLIIAEGVQPSTEIRGGDGCFAFIDQTNGNLMLTSSQYGNYAKHDANGNNLGTVISGSQGSFINPGDYDDRENILYSAIDNSTTSISRVINVTGSPVEQTLITSLSAEVSHLRVSPFAVAGTTNLFVGSSNGDVFKITNAQSNTLANTSNISPQGSGSISCIEVGATENELLITRSSYNVTSVYYSNNGGASWVSKEGDLPNMPVRWALFNPLDRNEVLLATEVGIWGITDLSAASPHWEPHVNGMANVRVDMLQVRTSDNEVLAATHGRGFYTSSGFNGITPLIAGFTANDTNIVTSESVVFTDASTGSPDSWLWSFEGGTPATYTGQTPPAIAYLTEGCFNVSLRTAKGLDADTLIKTCYINVGIAPPCNDKMSWDIDNDLYIDPTDSGSFQILSFDEDQLNPNNGGNGGWSVMNVDSNNVLGATSWFNPSGQAANWLYFGPITLPINSAEIQWKHMMLDVNFRDGYQVIINTDGIDISDFEGSSATIIKSFTDNDPLTSLDTVLTQQQATIPTAYLNQEVYIAFYHNANDMNVLYLDDIIVNGCELTEPPVADFSSDVQIVEAGGLVDFTDESTGNASSWLWDFGGGTGNNTLQNPQDVQFANAGCYEIRLTATNNVGPDTETKTCFVEAIALPVADFIADTVTIPEGTTVNFTDLSTNSPDAWSWSFEGAVTPTSTVQNPTSIKYNSFGCYEVSLVASKQGLAGTGETKTCYINVIKAPVADFEADRIMMSVGETVDFTDLSDGSVDAWSWLFPGSVQGNASVQNPEGIQYNNPGVYTVDLTVSILGLYPDTESKNLYLTVIELPVSDFTVDTITIWEGEIVNFTDLSTNNPDAWNWTLTGSVQGTSTLQNPTSVQYSAAGCYEVSLTTTKSGLSGSTETKTCFITVLENPNADFGATATLIAVGDSIDFDDLSTGILDTWTWTFSGAVTTSSAVQNPTSIKYN